MIACNSESEFAEPHSQTPEPAPQLGNPPHDSNRDIDDRSAAIHVVRDDAQEAVS
jgi:hypothetical protein